MLITVALSVEEYRALERLARSRADMDAARLLRCVAGDLIHSEWTGGSDERMYAHQWLDRRYGDGERFDIGPAWLTKAKAEPVAESEALPDYFDRLVAKKGGQS